MKWGHYYEAESSQQLLFWVIECVIRPYNAPLDRWLQEILKPGGGLGGDPGWEMEHIPSGIGAGSYRVWADPEISGLEPSETIYSSEEVNQALRESLLAFAQTYPEKENEVKEMLDHYHL